MHRLLQPVKGGEREKKFKGQKPDIRAARARERGKTEYRGGIEKAKEGGGGANRKGYSSCASSSNCSNLAICLRSSVVGQHNARFPLEVAQ